MMRRVKLSKSKKKLPLFNKPLKSDIKLNVEEGLYFYTRGGWVARILYVNKSNRKCFAVHNPGTPYEAGPIAHELESGFAVPMFSFLEPPAFTGHPADLVKEVNIT